MSPFIYEYETILFFKTISFVHSSLLAYQIRQQLINIIDCEWWRETYRFYYGLFHYPSMNDFSIGNSVSDHRFLDFGGRCLVASVVWLVREIIFHNNGRDKSRYC